MENPVALKPKWPLAALALLSLLYCLTTIVPGRFAVTDEVFFKAAGRNWAATGHFAAPELAGRLTGGPPLSEIYFAQPPVYTFLFGLYTKLVGFSPRTCIAYDTLIHLLLVWTGVVFARFVFTLDWNWAALCGALLIPFGTVGRPDELGIVWALWAAIAFRSSFPDKVRVALGGALLGLCACTSLGAAVFLGPIVVLELFATDRNAHRRIADLTFAAIVAFAVAAACVSPILISHPTAYKQLIEHAGEQSLALSALTGESRNSSAGLLRAWTSALKYGYSYGFLILGLLLFVASCWSFGATIVRPLYKRFSVAALSLVILFVAMPGKYLYLWFQGSWLLIACVALGHQIWPSIPSLRKWLLAAVGACIFLTAAMPNLRWAAIMWTLPSDQSLTASTKQLQAEIPSGAGVMTTDSWWALANRNRVYNALFSNPDPDAIDYVVLSGNGSGRPGIPVKIKRKYTTGFTVVDDRLSHDALHLGPFRLSRSAYGFGAYVLARPH